MLWRDISFLGCFFFNDRNQYFLNWALCWGIAKFYQFCRVVYFKFISDPELPGSGINIFYLPYQAESFGSGFWSTTLPSSLPSPPSAPYFPLRQLVWKNPMSEEPVVGVREAWSTKLPSSLASERPILSFVSVGVKKIMSEDWACCRCTWSMCEIVSLSE